MFVRLGLEVHRLKYLSLYRLAGTVLHSSIEVDRGARHARTGLVQAKMSGPRRAGWELRDLCSRLTGTSVMHGAGEESGPSPAGRWYSSMCWVWKCLEWV